MQLLLSFGALCCFSSLAHVLALSQLRKPRSGEATSPTKAFQSAQCQAEIAKERDRFHDLWLKNLLQGDSMPDQILNSMATESGITETLAEQLTGGGNNGLHISNKYNFAYVANQKVASMSFSRAFGKISGYDHNLEKAMLPYSANTLKDLSEKIDGKILFTFVRSPLDVAYSAYKEVSHRGSYYEHKVVDVPCDAGDARYLTYLQSLQNGSLNYGEVFHSWPQVVKVDTLSNLGRTSFDFIGRIENLDEDFAELFKMIRNNLKIVPEDFDDMAQEFKKQFLMSGAHKRGTSCDEQIEASGSKDGLEDANVCKVACSIYSSDFECLGYARPSCCH